MGHLSLFLLLATWIKAITCEKRIYEEGFAELVKGDILEFRGRVKDVDGGSLMFNIELCPTRDCKGTSVAILSIYNEQMISLFTRINGRKIPGTPQQTIDAPIIKDKKFSIKITAGEDYGIQVNDGKPTKFAFNVRFTELRYFVITEIGDKSMISVDEEELRNEAIAPIHIGDKLVIHGKVAGDDFRFDISFCTDEECGEMVLNVDIDSNETKWRSFKEEKWLNEQITPTKIVKGQEFKLIFSMENGIVRILESAEPLHIFVVNVQPVRHLKMRCGFSVRTNVCKTQIMDVKWTRVNSLAVSTTIQPTPEPEINKSTTVELASTKTILTSSAAPSTKNTTKKSVKAESYEEYTSLLWVCIGILAALLIFVSIAALIVRKHDRRNNNEGERRAEWKRERARQFKENERQNEEFWRKWNLENGFEVDYRATLHDVGYARKDLYIN